MPDEDLRPGEIAPDGMPEIAERYGLTASPDDSAARAGNITCAPRALPCTGATADLARVI